MRRKPSLQKGSDPVARRRRYKVKNIVILILVLLIAIGGITTGIWAISNKGSEEPAITSSTQPESTDSSADASSSDVSDSSDSQSRISEPDDDWQLVLANLSHPLPEDFSVDLTTITGNYADIPALDNMKVDSRIVEPLLKMFQDAKQDGQNLFLRASHRTIALQQTYYDWHINHYKEQGYSDEKAKALTLEYIAYPGCSEHHTGLAVDIISVEWQNSGKEIIDTFEETSEAKWLAENAHKYGFIMRYPKDKEDITKIGYEPWHFRYVGVAHATAIYNAGQCLEEYLGVLD